jgi:hypothetical protein
MERTKNTKSIRPFHRENTKSKGEEPYVTRLGLGSERQESWERKQAGSNREERVGCSYFSMSMVVCHGERETALWVVGLGC